MAGQRTVQAKWTIAGVVVGSLVFLWLATILPRTTTTVFASPDESAVAQFARNWTWQNGFSLPTHIPESLNGIAGLHPRSMIQQGTKLVPVGFLGMPILVLPLEWIWKGSGAFLTAILILSSAFALWHVARFAGRWAAWSSVIVYLTFPTVLLYANRGLFPNLPVVALGIWSIYLLRRRDTIGMILGGIATGIALLIRPVEAVWLLPWVLWTVSASSARADRKRIGFAIGAACLVGLLGYAASVQTYGSWTPVAGYWLEDRPVPAEITAEPSAPVMQEPDLLPFGWNLRAVARNAWTFLFGFWGPWVGIALIGVAMWIYQRKVRIQNPAMLLTGWTVIVLLLFYGQSIYTDNIRGNAAQGNSFLRYLLPLVPLIAVGIGMFVEAMREIKPRGVWIAAVLVAFFVIYGPVSALVRDEESILSVRPEIVRYEHIRSAARSLLPEGTVILSERSDKIFVGEPFVVVSPLPSYDALKQLRDAGVQDVAFFHRTIDTRETTVEVLASFGNEILYRLYP